MSDTTTIPRHPDGTPQRLGRYRLVRPISTGGMARVFEGRRESLAGVAPRVAVKVILPDFAEDEGFRELFVNEARIGAVLQHPNLVQIQDFDAEHGLYYIVMEYVEGVTLRRAISLCRRHGLAIPATVVAEVGRQVCEGLHHAHTATDDDGRPLHLVHRDIKPSNLMVNPQGVVKLLDFGVSRALSRPERAGAVRGTWGYMAPEQASGEHLSPTADLFGLAAVLYELAALEPLFPEKGTDAVRELLARDEAARRAARLVGVPGRFVGVLVRALQRDPAARFTSAAAMAQVLAKLTGDPIVVREQLLQFRAVVEDLAERPPDPGTTERPRSSSTLGPPVRPVGATGVGAIPPVRAPARSAPGEPGLPVRFGDLESPEPALGRPGTRSPVEPPRGATQRPGVPWLQIVGAGLFVAVAAGILSFTAWRLLDTAPAPPPVPRPVPDNPLAGLVADEPVDADPLAKEEDPLPNPAASPAPPPPEPRLRRRSRHDSADEIAAAEEEEDVVSPRIGAETYDPLDDPLDEPPTSPREHEPVAVLLPPEVDGPTTEVASAAPATVGQTGVLTVSSIPRAQVVLDGRFIRYSPLFRFKVDAGERVVTLITDDGRRATFRVEVPDGGEVRKVYSFETGAFTGE